MPLNIKVRHNGPYLIDLTLGEVSLTDHEGRAIPIPEGKSSIALCRCGGSTKKPFCDGTHSKIGFIAAQAAQQQADAASGAPTPAPSTVPGAARDQGGTPPATPA